MYRQPLYWHFQILLFFSDGGGRSGVFMAIDANMELVEEDGVVDIFGYMKKLRQARRGLVETLVSPTIWEIYRTVRFLLTFSF